MKQEQRFLKGSTSFWTDYQMSRVLIIAGSMSDETVVEKATCVLDELDISYRVDYVFAHREPEKVKEIVTDSYEEVIIAIAGLATALPRIRILGFFLLKPHL